MIVPCKKHKDIKPSGSSDMGIAQIQMVRNDVLIQDNAELHLPYKHKTLPLKMQN